MSMRNRHRLGTKEVSEDTYFERIKALLNLAGIPDIEDVIQMRKSCLAAGYEPTKLLIPQVYILGMPVEFADVDQPKVEFK